jgi:hypothetical protein
MPRYFNYLKRYFIFLNIKVFNRVLKDANDFRKKMRENIKMKK